MRNLISFCVLLCLQSCIVFHQYNKITTFNQPINANKIRLDGYFVAKVTKHFDSEDTTSKLYTYYYCKTFYDDGARFYLGAYDDTTYSLKRVLYYHPMDTIKHPTGYCWSRYCIQNDTLIEQSFYHTGAPFVFMWKVEEKRFKVINNKTLLGIDVKKNGKRKPLNENYYFMENTNYKPSSYNATNKYLNRFGTKNRYAFFPWVQLWPWW